MSWSNKNVLLGSLTIISSGYNLSVYNTPLPTLSAYFGWCGDTVITESKNKILLTVDCPNALFYQQIFNGIFFLSAAFGSLISGYLMNKFGCWKALAILNILLTGSVLLGGLAWNSTVLVISRLLTGVAAGLATVIPAVFISELISPEHRIVANYIPQIANNFGMFLGICAGLYLHQPLYMDNKEMYMDIVNWNFNSTWWRYMIAATAPLTITALIFLLFEFSMTKTQSYSNLDNDRYSRKSHDNVSYTKERKHDPLPTVRAMEIERINTTKFTDNRNNPFEINSLDTSLNSIPLYVALTRHPIYRKRLLVGWSLAAFQQLTGITVFMALSNSLFASAGLSENHATVASAAMAFLGFACSIIPPIIMSQLPRRLLFIFGAFGMTFALLLAIIAEFFAYRHLQFVVISSVLVFVSIYSITFGPGLFLYLNELFQNEIKNSGLAVAFTLNWLTCFIIVSIAPMLKDMLFVIFSGVSTLAAIFAYYFAPETLYCNHS